MSHFCFLALDYPTCSGGGGVGNQAQLLGQYLVRLGHRVSVITLKNLSGLDFWEDQGVQVFAAKSGSWHWYLNRVPLLGALFSLPLREIEYSLAAWRKIRQIHAENPIDLVEGSETGCLGVALLMKQIPLIVRLHGEVYSFHKFTPDLPVSPGIWLSRFFQRIAIRRADVLVSPSQVHAAEIQSEVRGLRTNIDVIPNCIDMTVFKRQIRDASSRKKMVLFSGRLEKRKGVDLLLQAARLVMKKHPQTVFMLAGAPHVSLEMADCKAYLHQHHLDQSVQFLGHVPWPRLLQLYHQASVFVLPSFYETFGIVALEAMAAGTPVIGWDAGALSEIIADGVHGILVAPGDVDALAEAISVLLENSQKRSEMGIAAHQHAADYDVAQLIERNLAFFEEVLDEI